VAAAGELSGAENFVILSLKKAFGTDRRLEAERSFAESLNFETQRMVAQKNRLWKTSESRIFSAFSADPPNSE
jgi:hypothetical protein